MFATVLHGNSVEVRRSRDQWAGAGRVEQCLVQVRAVQHPVGRSMPLCDPAAER